MKPHNRVVFLENLSQYYSARDIWVQCSRAAELLYQHTSFLPEETRRFLDIFSSLAVNAEGSSYPLVPTLCGYEKDGSFYSCFPYPVTSEQNPLVVYPALALQCLADSKLPHGERKAYPEAAAWFAEIAKCAREYLNEVELMRREPVILLERRDYNGPLDRTVRWLMTSFDFMNADFTDKPLRITGQTQYVTEGFCRKGHQTPARVAVRGAMFGDNDFQFFVSGKSSDGSFVEYDFLDTSRSLYDRLQKLFHPDILSSHGGEDGVLLKYFPAAVAAQIADGDVSFNDVKEKYLGNGEYVREFHGDMMSVFEDEYARASLDYDNHLDGFDL